MNAVARRATLGWCLGAAFALVGCSPARDRGEPRELETVDVTAAPDAALSIEGDARERRRAGTLAGVLPDGFPREIPVYRPSSVVEIEDVAGRQRVAFDTPASRGEVAAWYPAKLRAAGFRESGEGGGGRWARPGLTLELAFESRPSGTRFSIVY